MSGALQAVFQNQRSFGPPPGQQAYTTPGSYTWVAPSGVTSVSAVVVASGAPGIASGCYCGCKPSAYGGAGGGLSYKNNYSVTPGGSYSLQVGSNSCNSILRRSWFVSTGVVYVQGRGNCAGDRAGDGGGNGGGTSYWACYSTCNKRSGGGGAGGYSGNGGTGGTSFGGGSTAGSGGGGGGSNAYGGGGVGVLGQGSNGGACGVGGSGGANGTSANNGTGGLYGGGSGSGLTPGPNQTNVNFAGIGTGAVRIIWPGSTRSFPSTCTGDL